jgi:hypothetical protein
MVRAEEGAEGAMVDTPSSEGLVADIDHAMLHASDADALLARFAGTLALPLAFPLAERSGARASGGVFAGNVLIEVLRWAVRLPWDLPAGSARVAGLALHAAGPVDTTVALLDARGIVHTAP